MCLCNLCGKRGGDFKRCRCTLAAYCCGDCRDRDHARVGGHGEWCISKDRGTKISQIVWVSEHTSEACLRPWRAVDEFEIDCVVPLHMGVGDRASVLMRENQVMMTERMKDLHRTPSGGVPKRYLVPFVEYKEVVGFPKKRWFMNNMVMECGTVVPFVVCPVGTKSVSIVCKGECTYVVLLNRIGREWMLMQFSHSSHAQDIVCACTNVCRWINVEGERAKWMSGCPGELGDLRGKLHGPAERVLNALLYSVTPKVGPDPQSWAELPTSPIVVYTRVMGPGGGKGAKGGLEIPSVDMPGVYVPRRVGGKEGKGIKGMLREGRSRKEGMDAWVEGIVEVKEAGMDFR